MSKKKNESGSSAAIFEAVDLLVSKGVDLSTVLAEGGLLKQLTKRLVEKALESEMDSHLGYARYDRADVDNARNGASSKNLVTDNGLITIDVPRDREAKFEPALIPKRQTRVDGLDQKILSLYAKGMSLSDIKIQIEELYGADISESLISKITDDVMDDVKAWQSRPLESVYPIVFFDCLVLKVRQDKRIINKAVYVALGIDMDGKKDILGSGSARTKGLSSGLVTLLSLKTEVCKIYS